MSRPERPGAGRATLVLGTVLVALVAIPALVSVVWVPSDPTAAGLFPRLQGFGSAHPLGTDALGIDILARVMVGSRVALQVGLASVGLAAVIGIPVGLVLGLARDRGDSALVRWSSTAVLQASDILFAFPAVILAMVLAAAVGASTWTAVVAIGCSTIPVLVRLTRAATAQILRRDFVVAGRINGLGRRAIITQHVLPNLAPVLAVQLSVSVAMAILAEAGLSYLGLSTPSSTPTLGRMLFDAKKYMMSRPEQLVGPTLAIALLVLGLNLLADGLRDRLDPVLQESR